MQNESIKEKIHCDMAVKPVLDINIFQCQLISEMDVKGDASDNLYHCRYSRNATSQFFHLKSYLC